MVCLFANAFQLQFNSFLLTYVCILVYIVGSVNPKPNIEFLYRILKSKSSIYVINIDHKIKCFDKKRGYAKKYIHILC